MINEKGVIDEKSVMIWRGTSPKESEVSVGEDIDEKSTVGEERKASRRSPLCPLIASTSRPRSRSPIVGTLNQSRS